MGWELGAGDWASSCEERGGWGVSWERGGMRLVRLQWRWTKVKQACRRDRCNIGILTITFPQRNATDNVTGCFCQEKQHENKTIALLCWRRHFVETLIVWRTSLDCDLENTGPCGLCENPTTRNTLGVALGPRRPETVFFLKPSCLISHLTYVTRTVKTERKNRQDGWTHV